MYVVKENQLRFYTYKSRPNKVFYVKFIQRTDISEDFLLVFIYLFHFDNITWLNRIQKLCYVVIPNC